MSVERQGPARRRDGLAGRAIRCSPRLHGHWFERYGIDGTYVPLPVRPEDVELAFRALPRLGFLGWNVTVPHKEAACRLVDELDPAAARIGAVNTVLVLRDGRTRGLNTDGSGFLANLRQQAPDWRAGAGRRRWSWAPAARARRGGRRLAGGRRPDAAADQSHAPTGRGTGARAGGDRRRSTRCPGMSGRRRDARRGPAGQLHQPRHDRPAAARIWRWTRCRRSAVVADLVYAPLETDLLAPPGARGHVAVEGLGMLLHQAGTGFAHWGGVVPEVDERLRAAVLAAG